MTLEADGLPARPFFTCNREGLTIVDTSQANAAMRSGAFEPWMVFEHGEGNVIDSVPRKVASWDRSRLAVECEGGTVHIDFEYGTARKTTAEGEFIYMGSIDERNEGMGYIPVS